MWWMPEKDKRKAYLFEDGTLLLMGLFSAFSFPMMWLLTFISLIDQYLKSVKLNKELKLLTDQSSISEFIKLTENKFWVYLFFTFVMFILSLIGNLAIQTEFNLKVILLTSFVPIFSFLISNVVLIKLILRRGPKLFDLVICLGFIVGAVLFTFPWFNKI